MQSIIKVSISKADIEAQGPSAVARGNLVMNRLLAAGIPVLGVLFPISCSRGALIMSTDEFFGDYIYEWREAVPT
jgi:hypothetical protein